MARVFWADARAKAFYESARIKLRKMFVEAGMQGCIGRGDAVAIKVMFGARGNMATVRPPLVRELVECVKEAGGKPFLTDTVSLPYWAWAHRMYAPDYLKTAAIQGFTREGMGCPIIIAGGAFGEDVVVVPLPEGVQTREQYVAREIYEADVLISMAHSRGHPLTGFGDR